MNKIEAVEWMALVFDATVHVNTAGLASVTLNRGVLVDDRELVAILADFQIIARHHRDDREGGTLGLPTLGATAGMVVRNVALDRDLHLLIGAVADQVSAGEAPGARFHAVVDRRMQGNGHGFFPFASGSVDDDEADAL